MPPWPATQVLGTVVHGLYDLQKLLCITFGLEVLTILHRVVAPVMVQGPWGHQRGKLP